MPGWMEEIRASISGLFRGNTDPENAHPRRPPAAVGLGEPIVEPDQQMANADDVIEGFRKLGAYSDLQIYYNVAR